MHEDVSKGQWFVVQTLSGQENKVRDRIQKLISDDSECPIHEVYIPTEKVSEVRQGKKTMTTRKYFPGYILIRMDLYNQETKKIDEQAWYKIREVQGIIGFVGGGTTPVPLSAAEMADLSGHNTNVKEKVKPKIAFEIGEMVRIKDGAFENFEGAIQEIDAERGKLKLMVAIFGRSTPVELEFWQVDRA